MRENDTQRKTLQTIAFVAKYEVSRAAGTVVNAHIEFIETVQGSRHFAALFPLSVDSGRSGGDALPYQDTVGLHVCMEACHECRHSVHLMSQIAIEHYCSIRIFPLCTTEGHSDRALQFSIPLCILPQRRAGCINHGILCSNSHGRWHWLVESGHRPFDRSVCCCLQLGVSPRVRLLYMRTCL